MYHEEHNTFIQLDLLRVYFVGGTEIGKGTTFGCQNQSEGTGFGGGTEFFVTGLSFFVPKVFFFSISMTKIFERVL